MISVSCLDSKYLNNNNWYGRFQLIPFRKGEGLTIANALRRTLLTEKSNFYISWVDWYNAEIPYSILTGMRESIFDVLLNLKQIIFTSDLLLFVDRTKSPYKSPPGSKFDQVSRNSPKKKTESLPMGNFFPRKQFWGTKRNFSRVGTKNSYLSYRETESLPMGFPDLTSNIRGTEENISTIGLFRNEFKMFQHSNFSKGSRVSKNRFANHVISFSSQKKNGFIQIDSEKEESSYIGSICVKGPAVITAKHLKLPKGLKCIDPEKYLLTLADDGIFYVRFAIRISLPGVGEKMNPWVSSNYTDYLNEKMLPSTWKTILPVEDKIPTPRLFSQIPRFQKFSNKGDRNVVLPFYEKRDNKKNLQKYQTPLVSFSSLSINDSLTDFRSGAAEKFKKAPIED